jgi:hypothetical protein
VEALHANSSNSTKVARGQKFEPVPLRFALTDNLHQNRRSDTRRSARRDGPLDRRLDAECHAEESEKLSRPTTTTATIATIPTLELFPASATGLSMKRESKMRAEIEAVLKRFENEAGGDILPSFSSCLPASSGVKHESD